MVLDRTRRACPVKDKKNCSVTLNQPRFITFKEDCKITIKCKENGFVEDFLFKKGDWKLLLTMQYGEFYLQKEMR